MVGGGCGAPGSPVRASGCSIGPASASTSTSTSNRRPDIGIGARPISAGSASTSPPRIRSASNPHTRRIADVCGRASYHPRRPREMRGRAARISREPGRIRNIANHRRIALARRRAASAIRSVCGAPRRRAGPVTIFMPR
nr:hypothetical protein E2R29_09725 [Burkholderia pseudomallei]